MLNNSTLLLALTLSEAHVLLSQGLTQTRTLKVRLYPTGEQKQALKELQIRCAKLWNRANYLIRQEYFKNGEILSYNKLCNLMQNEKDYKVLPTIAP